MSKSSVGEDITFQGAIAHTQALLVEIEGGELSETEMEAAIAALIKSVDGARGFFVTYLTDDRPFADEPSAGVIRALESSPQIVTELLVKNLAMSSAMAITHRKRDDEIQAQGSDRVRSRTTQLLQRLNLPELPALAAQMSTSVVTGQGEYQEFLERWGYDDEQRQAIHQAFAPFTAQK